MLQQLKNEYQSLNKFQLLFFFLAISSLIALGLLHGGLIKLPPAPAVDCKQIPNSQTISINMNEQGFSPSDVDVQLCDTIVFTNTGKEPMWPAVGPHPTHTSYPGFDANTEINPNQSFRFTVNRPGSYTFHDHLHPELTGNINILPNDN